jgi:small-conductance mechanosensitive channel
MDYSQLLAGVRESLGELGAWVSAQQPRLIGALLLLLTGWLLAMLMRLIASRLLRAIARMVPPRLLQQGLPQPTLERQVSDVVGLIVFWAVMLFFVAAAADTVGLPVLSASLAGLGLYAPRLLGALLVVVFGLIVGNLARDAVTATAAAAGAPEPATLGRLVRMAILFAAGLIAVAELGIDITLLTVLLAVTLAAGLGAFALAFGLGARTAVSNIIGAHYLRRTFQAGQRVRVGDIEGTLVTITSTTAVIQVADGEVVVPASRFSEQPSTRLHARNAP